MKFATKKTTQHRRISRKPTGGKKKRWTCQPPLQSTGARSHRQIRKPGKSPIGKTAKVPVSVPGCPSSEKGAEIFEHRYNKKRQAVGGREQSSLNKQL